MDNATVRFIDKTGPGDYELPPVMAMNIVESHRKNPPRFSIGKSKKFNTSGMDLMLRAYLPSAHSPCSTRYAPDKNQLK